MFCTLNLLNFSVSLFFLSFSISSAFYTDDSSSANSLFTVVKTSESLIFGMSFSVVATGKGLAPFSSYSFSTINGSFLITALSSSRWFHFSYLILFSILYIDNFIVSNGSKVISGYNAFIHE